MTTHPYCRILLHPKTGGSYNGKYTYICKTALGKTKQEACDKLAELITRFKNTPYAAAGSTTVDQWFVQWRDTYKAPPA